MKESHIPVLIVGAGPSGLMAACQLSRYGINYRIIDQKEGTTPLSKALGVQARTMEIYEQMGIAATALEQGQPAFQANLMVNGKKVQGLPLNDVGQNSTPYPFLFILEQSKNEALLESYLKERNQVIEWNTEMLDLSQTETEASVSIEHKDGSKELIRADWVIGADGGKSPIRHALELTFEGDTYENIFYVVDTQVKWDLAENELHLNLAHSTFAGFFPMVGDHRYRIVGILPEKYQNLNDLTFDDIKKDIRESQHLDLEFSDTGWFSVYRVHHRCVNNFRKGRCFLAGDAAHVHSPAGGQGMNTGLQDVYNLAWKLAMVIKEQAPQSLLDTYNQERLPVAHRLVHTTDRAFSNVVSKGTLSNFFKLNILPFIMGKVMSLGTVRKKAFRTVSQIGIRYRKSSLSQSSIKLHKYTPHAGDRLPFVKHYDPKKRKMVSIYDSLHSPQYHAIIWLSNKDKVGEADAQKVHDFFAASYSDLVKVQIIHNITENMATFEGLQLKQSTLYLVRPDNYIAYIGAVDDLEALANYLSARLIGKPKA